MKHLLFIILGLYTMGTYAQKIVWSPTEKFNDPQIVGIQGQNDDGIYIIKKNWHRQDKNVTLEHYSEDLRLINEKIFATHKNEHYIQTGLYNNCILIYYSDYNKDLKKILVKVKTLTLNLIEKGKDTTILELPGKDIEPYNFHLYRQKHNNFALFTYKEVKDSQPVIQYLLIDNQVKTLAKGSLILSHNSNVPVETEQVAYTEKHIAFLIKENVDKKTITQGYKYTLYDGMPGHDELTATKLYGDSAIISDALLKTDAKNNAIVLIGSYSSKDSSYAKGYYFWKRNLSTNSLSISINPFTQKLIEDIGGKISKVKGVFNLKMGSIVLRQDGGVIIVGEQYLETKENLSEVNMYGTSSTNYRYNYYFHYNDMLIVSISSEGKEDWHSVIRKEQVSVNDNGEYSSYALISLPHKLVLLFNDISRKNWVLSSCEINEKGLVERNMLLRGQDYDAKLMPQFGDQISYNTLLIPGSNRKGEVFLKLSY